MAAPQPFCDVLCGYRISLAPDWRSISSTQPLAHSTEKKFGGG